MVEVWLFEDNLRPFLTAIGWLVGYEIDASDWQAVSQGMRNTDTEARRWYEYAFHGRESVALTVAFDEAGSSVVRLQFELPAEFVARVELLAEFCKHFHWRDAHA